MAQKLIFANGRVENIVGKGENAGYQHFLLFLKCFQDSLLGSFKVRTMWFIVNIQYIPVKDPEREGFVERM